MCRRSPSSKGWPTAIDDVTPARRGCLFAMRELFRELDAAVERGDLTDDEWDRVVWCVRTHARAALLGKPFDPAEGVAFIRAANDMTMAARSTPHLLVEVVDE